MSSVPISSQQASTNALTGSRVQFMLQGVLVAFGSNLSYSHNYTYQPLNVVGSLEVVSHIPVAYTASITFNSFKLLNRNLRTLGVWPKIGKTPQEHLRNLSAIPELTAVVTDTISDTIILIAEGVRIESSAIAAAANSLITEDVSAVVRRLYIEGDQ